MEERGWDTAPTAGGVYELLRDLSEIVPGVFELEIEELTAGLRPATPDNLPAIGPRRARRPGLGHRPLPQRDPAHAGHGRPRRRRAGRRADARVGRARRPAPIREGARMKVVLNGEAHRAARRRDRRGRARVARPARRRPRRRGRRRRRGRPARAVGATPSCTKGRGWRSCARSREAEMAATDTDILTIARQDAALAAAARHGRVPLARRAVRRARRVRLRARHRRAAPHRPVAARLDRRRARRAPASSCCRTPPAASRPATPC